MNMKKDYTIYIQDIGFSDYLQLPRKRKKLIKKKVRLSGFRLFLFLKKILGYNFRKYVKKNMFGNLHVPRITK